MDAAQGKLMRLALVAAMLIAPATLSAGPRRVGNSAPQLPPRTIELEELWRVGGAESEILLGSVTEAAGDHLGNVYLLDTQLKHVQVISPNGEHIGTIGREGDGPGEVRRPRDVAFMPDSTIGLLEQFPAKIVKLAPTGEPRGTVVIGGSQAQAGGFTAAGRCMSWRGTLLVSAQRLSQTSTGQHRDMYLCRISASGEELVRYCEAAMDLDFAKLHFSEREQTPGCHIASTIGPTGRVYVSQAWDRYAIDVYEPDGTPALVIEREFENRRRTPDELRRANAIYEEAVQNNPGMTYEIEPAPAVIAGLHVDARGRLWVLHSRSAENLPAGVMQAYDLFDEQGRYLRQVQIAGEGDPEYDGLEFLPDGRVLLIKGYVLAAMARTDLGNIALGEEEDSDPLEIICCRLRI